MKRNLIRLQELYPDAVDDADIIIPGKRKRRMYPEDVLQRAVVAYLRILGRTTQDRVRFIVAQPERFRTPVQQGRDKARGMQAGTPELLILDARSISQPRVIFIELKDPLKGRMSEAQLNWQTFCIGAGYEHAVVTSLDELRAVMR